MESYFNKENLAEYSGNTGKEQKESKEEKQKIKEKKLKDITTYVHLNLDDQEQVLASWIVAVFNCITVSLVFYSMLGNQSRVLNEKSIAIITISLIVVSLLLNLFSLVTFLARTNLIIESAKLYDHTTAVDRIKRSQLYYGTTTILVSLIEIFMVYVLIRATLIRLHSNNQYIF